MKALVININVKNATLLQYDGQFIKAKNNDYKIGDVINLKNNACQKRILTLAATAALLVMILAASVFAYATPAYYISLDVNPSLVLKVNIFERLIGMEALNGEAEVILDGLNWKNKDVDDVLSKAVQKIKQAGYLRNGGDILISAAGRNEARAAELLAGLKEEVEELALEDIWIQTETVGVEMVESAKGFSLTPGKYNLITKLLGENVDAENADEYQSMPVKDLMQKYITAKGIIGKERAETAKQNNGAGSMPSEAETGKEAAGQSDSDASQKASEAAERASEVLTTITELLPDSTNQPPVETTKGTEVEINPPSGVIPDVPANTMLPTLPATSSNRP